MPFGLGVFLALRRAEHVTRGGEHDKKLIAPHDKPRCPVAGEPRAARPLHDVERRAEQNVAAERKDHRGSVQRAQTAEVGPRQIEVEGRKGQLPSNDVADQKADNAPDHSGDGRHLDRAVHILLLFGNPTGAGVTHHDDGRCEGGCKEQEAVQAHGVVGAEKCQCEAETGSGHGRRHRHSAGERNDLFASCLHLSPSSRIQLREQCDAIDLCPLTAIKPSTKVASAPHTSRTLTRAGGQPTRWRDRRGAQDRTSPLACRPAPAR